MCKNYYIKVTCCDNQGFEGFFTPGENLTYFEKKTEETSCCSLRVLSKLEFYVCGKCKEPLWDSEGYQYFALQMFSRLFDKVPAKKSFMVAYDV